jgi:hypothetical protein
MVPKAVAVGDFVVMSFTAKDESGDKVLSYGIDETQGVPAHEVGHTPQIPQGVLDMVIGMNAGETKSGSFVLRERDEKLVMKIPRSVRSFKHSAPFHWPERLALGHHGQPQQPFQCIWQVGARPTIDG